MKKKILIIEDNKDLLAIYQTRFEQAGFEATTSSDGLSGIMKISEIQPDIILLDIMMPEMDGYEVLKSIKQNLSTFKRDTVVVVWSNLSGEKDEKKALEMGAHFYLRKSDYEGKDLVEKVISFL